MKEGKNNNFFEVIALVLTGLISVGRFGETSSLKSVFQVLTEESGDAVCKN